MKKFLFIALGMVLLTACQDSAVINGNPVVEQININPNATYKYEVKFRTKDNNRCAYMLTDFRYQVGDTLISYYEYFEGKLKPTQDSLAQYKKKVQDLQVELTNSKNYQTFLQEKINKLEGK